MPEKIIAKRTSLIMIILILCTMTIILTNYIFSKDIVININQTLLENEYKKIGGRENYMILQEIQRREIMGYIETIKKEQPELIEEILNPIDSDSEDETNYNMLNEAIINDLKNETYISGSSGALVSIIEFTDLECDYCIKQHNDGTIQKILETYPKTTNYSIKNFPFPSHKNAKIEARAAKCVEKISGGEKYIEYIDNIFSNTKGGGEGFETSTLSPLAESIGVDVDEFNNCLENNETKEVVEVEFNQGIMLDIKSVPAILLINNETLEYEIIAEAINYDDLEEKIENISK